ncbi:efflux RND transporter periplasmic adaptor subunit [Fretibacter rubidus]|uniref:efflux RND transporter periplasmic adaptor subunit n=1 Tax=Fretibacter rubidus TaxID=570162 RepID=UPI00352B7C8B
MSQNKNYIPQNSVAAQDAVGSPTRKLVVVGVIFAIILFAGLLLFLMAAGKSPPEAKKRRDPSLAIMAQQAYSDTVVLDALVQGQSRPRTEVDLTPQVGGKVVYVSDQFVAGGQFKTGDILLKIEEADFQVAVLRAQAGIARAEQLVIREKAEGEIARQDWADLGRGGEPSPLTLRKPQLAEAEANLLSAQADLNNAKLQLSRATIRAPFNGRIRERFADVGQFVGPGTRLARVFSTEAVEIPLSLNDADLTRVDIPLSMAVTDRSKATDVILSAVIAGKKQIWNGKIVRTDGTFDPQTRTLSAIVEVLDPYGKGASEDGTPLPPGLFVDADIIGRTLESAIVIPRDALRPEDKVYVVDDKGKAESRDAVVYDTNAQRAVLKSGVEPGEYVIVSPLEKSQLTLSFKVLDANDPTVVLIEPPKPDWVKKAEAEEAAKPDDKEEKRGLFGRKKKDDTKVDEKSDKKPGEGTATSDNPPGGGN